MTITAKLTGRTRARAVSRIFRSPLLILQVQEHREGYVVLDSWGNSQDVDDFCWRDARTEDMEELHRVWMTMTVEQALGGAV